MSIEDTVSVSADDRVRAMRDRMRAAKARVDAALEYVMFSEARAELRNAKADLAAALSLIDK